MANNYSFSEFQSGHYESSSKLGMWISGYCIFVRLVLNAPSFDKSR